MATKNPKKNLKQFKQALLSNTDFIKETDNENYTKPVEIAVKTDIIDPQVREKLKILSEFEGISEKEMINKALNHFLRLKGLQLEEAMKKKK